LDIEEEEHDSDFILENDDITFYTFYQNIIKEKKYFAYLKLDIF
jgi:hypothetical protein